MTSVETANFKQAEPIAYDAVTFLKCKDILYDVTQVSFQQVYQSLYVNTVKSKISQLFDIL